MNTRSILLSMTDDGFGLTLDMIKACHNLACQDNVFILEWENLEKSLILHNLTLNYTAKGKGQFILDIPISKEKENIYGEFSKVDHYAPLLSSSKKH